MSFDDFPEYVPVAERRARAQKKLQQLRKKHPGIKPVLIAGRNLANTWWGKSWNSNLERYADYSNRIGRGRSYARHGSILDLQIAAGTITALVQGSQASPYRVTITIAPLAAEQWHSLRAACEGRFDSLQDLLAGQFPQALKDLFFARGSGLFPEPRDIRFDCSCPDWASMCKHVAAALYGVGARLDEDPTLFFTLRGIGIDDLITRTVADTTQALLNKAKKQSTKVLGDIDVGAVFGIQMDNLNLPAPALPAAPGPAAPVSKKAVVPATTPAPPPQGTMIVALVKAVGKSRKGRSAEQLLKNLGWSKAQLRSAVRRASDKGLLETAAPGFYRQKM